MKKVSVSLEPSHVDALKKYQDETDADSRSAAVRDILDEYEELTTECEELRTECEELRTRLTEAEAEHEDRVATLRDRLDAREDRIDALEEQLARRSQIEEKVDLLAQRADETELTYAERRQRMIDQASLAERLRWKVTGVPVEDADEGG